MFRIQLASGEEAAFRTVEELALAIQSGIITSEARLHVEEGAWRPITECGAWEEAQGLVATLAPLETEEPGPPPILPMPEIAAVPSPVRIYRMFSRSGQEVAERHRSAWLLPTAIGLAVVLLLVAIVTSLRWPRATDEPHVAALGHGGGAQSLAGATAPPRAEDGHAPFNLAARWNQWSDSTNRAFADSARQLGLETVLNRSRLGSPESLEVSRQVLLSFRDLLHNFRATRVERERAYWDSALVLEQSGVWSPNDLEEWRTRALRSESPLAAARADSLNRNLDLLLSLLLNEQGHYDLSGDVAHFTRPEAGREYDQLRTSLTLNADTHGLPPEHPLAVLLQVVQHSPLPPRTN